MRRNAESDYGRRKTLDTKPAATLPCLPIRKISPAFWGVNYFGYHGKSPSRATPWKEGIRFLRSGIEAGCARLIKCRCRSRMKRPKSARTGATHRDCFHSNAPVRTTSNPLHRVSFRTRFGKIAAPRVDSRVYSDTCPSTRILPLSCYPALRISSHTLDRTRASCPLSSHSSPPSLSASHLVTPRTPCSPPPAFPPRPYPLDVPPLPSFLIGYATRLCSPLRARFPTSYTLTCRPLFAPPSPLPHPLIPPASHAILYAPNLPPILLPPPTIQTSQAYLMPPPLHRSYSLHNLLFYSLLPLLPPFPCFSHPRPLLASLPLFRTLPLGPPTFPHLPSHPPPNPST